MYLDTIMDTSISSTNAHRVPSLSYQPLVFDATLDTTNMHNLLLIDSTVPDFQQYANADTFAIIYDRTSSKEQLLEIVKSKFQNISRIAVVCHFSEEPNFLDNELLFSDTNTQFIVDIIKQFNVLHVDYLACNTLQSQVWTDYYTKIHSASGIPIGASNDNTGNLKYGGDWIMESTHEDIQTIYFNELIKNYSSLLVLLTINGINYTISGTTATVSTHTVAQVTALNNIVVIPPTITDANGIYTVTTIGDSAFRLCWNLTSINYPNTITTIGGSTLQGTNIVSIIIPDSVTYMGIYTFYDCNSLISVTIGSGITILTDSTFQGCTSLSSIIIPNTITALNDKIFWSCNQLNNIIIPYSVTYIGHRSFGRCTALTSIVLPNSITTLGTSIFESCSYLTSVTLPTNPLFTVIPTALFYSCIRLQSIIIPPQITSFSNGGGQFESTSISSIVISDLITVMSSGMFYGVGSLTSCTLSKTTNSINEYVFYGTSLVSIIIPSTVTHIGRSAFEQCNGLTSVYFEGDIPIIDANNFLQNSIDTAYYKAGALNINRLSLFTNTSPYVPSLPSSPTIIGEIIGLGDGKAIVNFVAGNSNGATIDSYKYSKNDGILTIINATTATQLIIPDVANGIESTIKIMAHNSVGDSQYSNTKTVTPQGQVLKPLPVWITGAEVGVPAGDGKASLTFTGGESRGSSIENYYYSVNGGSYVACTPAIKSAGTMRATGLENGIQSTIRMIVKDVSGNMSDVSGSYVVTSRGVPIAPTIDISLNQSILTINVQASQQGSRAETYYYSLDGITYTDASKNAGPITVNVPSSFSYKITVKGRNDMGQGLASGEKLMAVAAPASNPNVLKITYGTTTMGVSSKSTSINVKFTDVSGSSSLGVKAYEYQLKSGSTPTAWIPIRRALLSQKYTTTADNLFFQDQSYNTNPLKQQLLISNSLDVKNMITSAITITMRYYITPFTGVVPDSQVSAPYLLPTMVQMQTMLGTVVNGYISGGTIRIIDLYGNVIGGPVTTDSVGGYTVSGDNLPDYYIVSCVGGTNIATNQPLLTELKSVVMNIGDQSITDATVVLSPLTTIVTNLVKVQNATGVIDISGAMLKVATALDIPLNQVNQDYLATSNVQVASASVKMATITGSISSATGLLAVDVMASISELINNTRGKLLIDQSTVNTIVTTTTTNLGVNTPVPQSVLNTLSTLVVAVSEAINAPGLSLTTLYKTEVGATTLASGITSSSGDITGQLAGAVSSAVIGTITRPAAIITGNICYRKGTKIVTDQGIIDIENLTTHNSIRGKEVKLISKTKNIDDYLIKIEKGGLYENVPNADTYVTGEHKIYYKRDMIRAKKLVNGSTIKRVKCLNETMYNVLLEGENEGKMIANGLIGETLNPKGEMAKLLCYVGTLGLKEREEVIEEVNRNMKKEHEIRKQRA